MKPDFFLSSVEDDSLHEVRACFVERMLHGPRASGYWLVRVEPPIAVTGRPDAARVVLAERGADARLSELGADPMPVYVASIRNPTAVESGTISADDIELVSWAEIARKPSILLAESQQRAER